jgi:hypothetical protein
MVKLVVKILAKSTIATAARLCKAGFIDCHFSAQFMFRLHDASRPFFRLHASWPL